MVLRGYSGYNTRWALKVKEKVFPPSESGGAPLAVTVFFGANDACLPDRCRSFQHVPLDEYKQNLHAIVAFLKVKTVVVVGTRISANEGRIWAYTFSVNINRTISYPHSLPFSLDQGK